MYSTLYGGKNLCTVVILHLGSRCSELYHSGLQVCAVIYCTGSIGKHKTSPTCTCTCTHSYPETNTSITFCIHHPIYPPSAAVCRA